jgi:hypothetical protein
VVVAVVVVMDLQLVVLVLVELFISLEEVLRQPLL